MATATSVAAQPAAPAAPVTPLRSRVFDVGVVCVGVVLAVATVLGQQAPWQLQWPYLATVPLILLIARYPLLLDRRGGAIEIGFHFCLLVFLVCSTGQPGLTVLLWSAGVVLSQLSNDKRRATKVFNAGLSVLSGSVAVIVITAARGETRSSAQELAAVLAGCVAYFLADFVISAVSVALDDQTPIRDELGQGDALDAAACFIATACLGYFAALVVLTLPVWMVALLGVPLGILLVAARAVTHGRENSRRLEVLFGAAARAQTLHHASDVLAALSTDAHNLLHVRAGEVRPEPPQSHEIGARFDDGYQEQWIVARAGHRARSTIAADQQALEALAAVATEAFSRLRLTDEMTHLAQHDPLTGLPNRALFLDRSEHALRLARRRGARLAVLYCDLDGFKRVNDRFGHAAGDALLAEVGDRISACLRDSDTVARLGGDEFAVLLEDLEGDDQVTAVSNRILEVLRDRIVVADHQVSVTTSVGVAYSETADSADGLLRNADMAMYQAKANGKDQCATYERGLGQARVRRLELVEALRHAVDVGNLSVMYQPVVELRTGKVVGIEALARWALDGVAVAPDVFIGAAEESGLVVSLGEVVLDLVTADAPALREAAAQRLTLGVNISSQQMRSQPFVEKVLSTLGQIGDLELLLEVTERDFVPNDASALDVMGRLADAGVRFAVDDFGIGFSSIGYLQQLPVHVLKTDRSFSVAIDRDERACRLLRSMVVMGEALGLDVVVEGVERPAQLDHLERHVFAPLAQGYLLHRPMSLPQVLSLLATLPRVEPTIAVPTPLKTPLTLP
jgi:diguanylate cyclase (GGDEF)-like protein